MQQSKTIKVPSFIDDPMVGRVIFPLTFGIFQDKIIIKNGILTYVPSKISGKQEKSFSLRNITKIILGKRKVSCWTKDHKLDPYGVSGTKNALSFVLDDGEKYELIPFSLVDKGQRQWDRFLHNLVESSGLPIEELQESL